MTDSRPGPAGLWCPVDGADGFPAELLDEGAFLPHPLRSDLVFGNATHVAVADAQEAVGRLDEAAARLPNWRMLERTTQFREVYSSAEIDGIEFALREGLILMLPGVRPTTEVSPKIERYLAATRVAYESIREGAALSGAGLARISAAFAGEGALGEDAVWRAEHAGLGGPDACDVYLIAAPPGAGLIAAVEQLLTWAEDADGTFPVVIKVALAHLQLELLRPFRYGNGHIARIYVGAELTRLGLLRGQLLPISQWIDRHRVEYRAQIRRVVNTGEVEPWVVFFARGVRATAAQEIQLITRLEETRDRLLAELPSRVTGNVRRLLESMVATPVINHRFIMEQHGLSRKTATELTRRLTDYRVLELHPQAGGRKPYASVFLCPPLLNVFTDTPPPPTEDRGLATHR